MNFINKHRQFILGFILGSSIIFLLMRSVILQEFSGLEAVGNDSYLILRNELLDDMVGFPIIFIGYFVFILLVTAGVASWFDKKLNKTKVNNK